MLGLMLSYHLLKFLTLEEMYIVSWLFSGLNDCILEDHSIFIPLFCCLLRLPADLLPHLQVLN